MIPTVATGPSTGLDTVVLGGRVIDPETGLDTICNVGITGGVIVTITSEPITGSEVIDAEGLIVAPGFIDLHSHAQGLAEHRLQALDGVTTALELEAGLSPVSAAYAMLEAEGRPLNFGFSASWAAVRMNTLAGRPMIADLDHLLSGMADLAWRGEADDRQLSTILGVLEQELANGALGIGLLLGYAPEVSSSEYAAVAGLAAAAGMPTFTHARPLIEQEPGVLIDGASEIAQVAASTGAHMHYCHINSTSNQHLDRVAGLIAQAQSEGAAVTTEGYPYGAGMTAIGSGIFAPHRLHVIGVSATDVVHARTNERMSGPERLLEVRAADPGGLAFVHYYDESVAPERLLQAIGLPGSAIASDALPLVSDSGALDPEEWPVRPDARTHPRLAGTYARSLRLAREHPSRLSVVDVLAKSSLYPARVLETAAPAMRRKGRIQIGCDADLVMIDIDAVTDDATYEFTARPSRGFQRVMVNGESVVKDGKIQLHARPGRAIRSRA